jgi:hypothetical protein
LGRPWSWKIVLNCATSAAYSGADALVPPPQAVHRRLRHAVKQVAAGVGGNVGQAAANQGGRVGGRRLQAEIALVGRHGMAGIRAAGAGKISEIAVLCEGRAVEHIGVPDGFDEMRSGS